MRPRLERLALPEALSFQAFERRARHYPFDWHHHPELELTLITRGSGRRYVGDSVEDYASGDCVFLGSGVPHAWASLGRGMQTAIVVQFREEWIRSLCAAAPELSRIGALLARAGRGVRFSRGVGLSLAGPMRSLVESTGIDRLAALLKILEALARLRGARPLASAGYMAARPMRDERIAAVNEHLRKHFTEPVTQEEVAEIAGLTPAAFCRFFKRATGRTFIAHLHELRVSHACRLLVETAQPITAACFASGFGNLSNFNRVFRRLKKSSPREYRALFEEADVSD